MNKVLVSFLLISFFLSIGLSQVKKMNLFGGFIDGKNLISIRMTEKIHELPKPEELKIISDDNKVIELKNISISSDPFELKLITKNEINIKKEYYIVYNENKKRLVMNEIYKEPAYYDLSSELGSIYNKKFTTFRLFAPRATKVKVLIYDNPTRVQGETFLEYDLIEKKGGVWEVKVQRDLSGKYYTYKLISVGADCFPELEVVDPYSKIITRGDGLSVSRKNSSQPFDQTLGRSMIIDLSKTGKVSNLTGDNRKIEDAIIWEVHTRDLTRSHDSGIPEDLKGLFKGAIYKGSKYKNFSTGFDHVKELGVTVVQFLPVNEFVVGNEFDFKKKYIEYNDQGSWPEKRYYDWGYGPIGYFSPEGWYSTNINNYSRISELKEIVSEFHKAGIRVTFDVVFNHTFEGSRKVPNTYLFRGIDADYYYRSQADETFYDGISCQNELKTENPMVAKFIIDCLRYWVTEFKVDGFRFDWLSALDPETMAKLVKTLKAINPDILLYGELWTLRGLSYKGKNTGTYVDRQHIGLFEKDYNLQPGSLAGFNDYFRDAVKGSGFMRDYAGGYIQNTVNEKYYPSNPSGHLPFELTKKVIKGMVGYISKDEDKTEWQEILSTLNSINYIDCHDGYTLYDKLIIAEYCGYLEPGGNNSPKKNYPQSESNPKVVDFKDQNQFSDSDVEMKIKKMNLLGAAILLTSQGIPFMHAGQELLRQKINYVNSGGSKNLFVFDPNSNTSSDEVNSIKWENKEKNIDVFNYYKGLIKLRKEHPTFKRITRESVMKGMIMHDDWLPKDGERCIAYNLIDPKNEIKNEKWKNVIVLINPYPETKAFKIPKGEWNIVVNHEKAGVAIINKINRDEIRINGISMMILYN